MIADLVTMQASLSRQFVDDKLCPAPLLEMFEIVRRRAYPIDGIAVMKGGDLKLDIAFSPYATATSHPLYSCTKSILGILVGICIDKGIFESVQTPIVELLPRRALKAIEASRSRITVEHLLTMTAGLNIQDHAEDFQGFFADARRGSLCSYILNKPLACSPGTRFQYNNSGSHLLACAIQEMTGLTPLEFARENLFDPLGIHSLSWRKHPESGNTGWSGLAMRPADLARIGEVILRGGQYKGRRIVSSDWVQRSTTAHVDAEPYGEYGYHWWVKSSQYHAAGFFGQYLFVRPDDDLVVVITGSLKPGNFLIPQYLLERFIAPAFAVTGAGNSAELSRLQDAVQCAGVSSMETGLLCGSNAEDGHVFQGEFIRTSAPSFRFTCPARAEKIEIRGPHQVAALQTFDGSIIRASERDVPASGCLDEAAQIYQDMLRRKSRDPDAEVTSLFPLMLQGGHEALRMNVRYRMADGRSCTAVTICALHEDRWICLEGHTGGDPEDMATIIESLSLQ